MGTDYLPSGFKYFLTTGPKKYSNYFLITWKGKYITVFVTTMQVVNYFTNWAYFVKILSMQNKEVFNVK